MAIRTPLLKNLKSLQATRRCQPDINVFSAAPTASLLSGSASCGPSKNNVLDPYLDKILSGNLSIRYVLMASSPLSIYLPIYLLFILFIYLSIYLSIYQSINVGLLSIYLSIYFLYRSIYQSISSVSRAWAENLISEIIIRNRERVHVL